MYTLWYTRCVRGAPCGIPGVWEVHPVVYPGMWEVHPWYMPGYLGRLVLPPGYVASLPPWVYHHPPAAPCR